MDSEKILEENKDKRSKCEIFTRAMGYIRGIDYFNKGKKSEFHERKYFTEKKAIKGATDEKRSDS